MEFLVKIPKGVKIENMTEVLELQFKPYALENTKEGLNIYLEENPLSEIKEIGEGLNG